MPICGTIARLLLALFLLYLAAITSDQVSCWPMTWGIRTAAARVAVPMPTANPSK